MALRITTPLAFAVSLVAGAAFAQQPQLPPGEGRDIVATACTQCHTFQFPTTLREGPAGWRFHVQDMVIRGAQLNAAEVEILVDYLANNFAPGMNLPPAIPVNLPEGAGKQLVEQSCIACHDLQKVGNERLGRKDWDRVMAHMIELGAPLSPETSKIILGYLQEKFPGK